MTFFLIGYAVGLKEKIKTVMRSFMIFVCIFVLYTSVAHAQTITGEAMGTGETLVLESTSTVTKTVTSNNSEVTEYISRLLAMQTQAKWKNSPAFSEGNYAFFEGLNKQLGLIPSDDHIDMVNYTLKQISGLTNDEATKKFNIQKGIIIAVLTGIKDMAMNDYNTSVKDDTKKQSMVSNNENQNNAISVGSNKIYSVEYELVDGKKYYIYTLKEKQTIKHADFIDEKGSFVHCMYSQCNRLIFSESRLPTILSVQYILGEKNERIDLTKSTSSITPKEQSSKSNVKKDEVSKIDDLFMDDKGITNKTTTSSTTTVATQDDDDLLQELSDIFGGAF